MDRFPFDISDVENALDLIRTGDFDKMYGALEQLQTYYRLDYINCSSLHRELNDAVNDAFLSVNNRAQQERIWWQLSRVIVEALDAFDRFEVESSLEDVLHARERRRFRQIYRHIMSILRESGGQVGEPSEEMQSDAGRQMRDNRGPLHPTNVELILEEYEQRLNRHAVPASQAVIDSVRRVRVSGKS